MFYFPITVSGTIRPPYFWQGRSGLHWEKYVFRVNDRNMRLQIQEFSCAKETKDFAKKSKTASEFGSSQEVIQQNLATILHLHTNYEPWL